ncbi:MAG: ArsI/CadI family heavy metal resistance metalloenzyme [Deltaproteobacteria bacterium]|nr:ArsI/CadI family heavy metal resistance metalloenzyme [Deltaproteobacteria bacterium]
MRLQLAINVKDIDAAVDFYSKMFNTPVNKRKPGYANFAITDPPLKLVLFEMPDAPERLNHLGVEVFEDEEVTAATERLKTSGMEHLVEDQTTCYYAKQNKVWAVEPDGMRWEWYRVIEDLETFNENHEAAPGDQAAWRP